MTLESHLRGSRPILTIAQFNAIDPDSASKQDDGLEVGVWIPASESSAVSDVLWYFRYRVTNPDGSANSPSDGFLWDYIGGVAAFIADESMTSYQPAGGDDWVYTTDSGPDLHAPMAGRFEFGFGAQIGAASSGEYARIGLENGIGHDPVDPATCVSSTTQWVTAFRVVRLDVVNNARIRMMYRDHHDSTPSGPNSQFQNRYISMLPVRV